MLDKITILEYATNGAPRTCDFFVGFFEDAVKEILETRTCDHAGYEFCNRDDFIEGLEKMITLASEEWDYTNEDIQKLQMQKHLASQQPAECYFLTTPNGAWLYTTPESALRSSELASIADIRGLFINDKQIYRFAKAKHCKVSDYDFEF